MGQITWMKNDKIKTMREFTYFFFGHEEACKMTSKNPLMGAQYTVPEDIDLLHLKKVSLPEMTFECLNENTILILEDCNFGVRTRLKQGNIIIEHPRKNKNTKGAPTISFKDIENVELILSNEASSYSRDWDYILDGVSTLSVTGDAKDATIFISSHQERLQSIKLNNVHNLSLSWLEAKKIEVENSEITLRSTIEPKQLHIVESTITAPCFEVEGEVEIKNSKIKSYRVAIAGNVYTPKNGELVFSDEKEENGNISVAYTKLISDLKVISMEATNTCRVQEENIKQQVEKRYEEKILQHEKEIEKAQEYQEYYANLIVEQQATISDINREIDAKMENIKDGLAKQKIRTVVPKK